MLSFAVSFVQPMFISYYLIVCVPALSLFGTAAIVQIRSLAVAAALVVLLVLLTATRLIQYYRSDRDLFENWRDATRYVLDAAHTEDGIVFFPDYARTPFDYYVRQMKVAGPVNIQRLPLTHQPRIWLMIRQSDAGAHSSEVQRLQSSLTEHHWIADRHKFQGVGVELYVQRAG